MIKKFAFAFLMLFVITSCQGKKKEDLKTSLTVKFDNEEADALKFLYFSESSSLPYFVEPKGEDGVFRVNDIQISGPIFGELSLYSNNRYRLKRVPCYIEAGSNVEIAITGTDITYSGDLVKENEFLKDAASKAFLTHYKGSRLNGSEGFKQLNGQLNEELSALEKLEFNEEFKTFLKEWTNYRYASIKYAIIDKTNQNDWPAEFTSFIKNTVTEKFESSALLGSMSWFYFLDEYFRTQDKFSGQETDFNSNLDKIANPLIKERYILYYYNKMISSRKGLDGIARKGLEPLRDYMVTDNGKTDYNNIIEKLGILEKNYAHLMPGQEAPKFKFEDVNGNMIALEDFKGKYVFIDVWNIYCGPCIKQIPYLRKYEEELKNENIEFIGVSCDKQEEKQKWRDFVAKKEMVGHQLIMDNGRNSRFLADYQIIGFPTFIIVDPEGKMVSYRFLEPADKNFMPTLHDILKS
ncbi:TlpA family protein disulfide reductase [Gaetbulibacter saemankumensis]|uniref:TlpA family protein disulfide reductase n=1 Tax=Gaetbulibacter saemankumensis TaxID=311208 RepID=UPI000683DE0C|nr:TlpA disulfide reductase family protein [Gaetbulibacter saemankumensis]